MYGPLSLQQPCARCPVLNCSLISVRCHVIKWHTIDKEVSVYPKQVQNVWTLESTTAVCPVSRVKMVPYSRSVSCNQISPTSGVFEKTF